MHHARRVRSGYNVIIERAQSGEVCIQFVLYADS